jgi:cell wall-associated NlpC family hydrolase
VSACCGLLENREVRMNGNHATHSILKLLATLVVAALASSTLIGPAEAHERSNAFAQRKHIKKRGKSAVGAPYSYGGSSRGGFDCSGFTRWTFGEHGQNLPRTSIDQFGLGKKAGYKRIWKRKNLKVGDLVFHKTTSARVGHAGVFVGGGRFVSATSSEGVQVRSLHDPYYWGSRWVGAVRTPSTINK